MWDIRIAQLWGRKARRLPPGRKANPQMNNTSTFISYLIFSSTHFPSHDVETKDFIHKCQCACLRTKWLVFSKTTVQPHIKNITEVSLRPLVVFLCICLMWNGQVHSLQLVNLYFKFLLYISIAIAIFRSFKGWVGWGSEDAGHTKMNEINPLLLSRKFRGGILVGKSSFLYFSYHFSYSF